MQTVLFKNIGDFKIITGFSQLSIDPVATEKVVIKKFQKTKVGKKILALTLNIKSLNESIIKINPAIPHCEDEQSIRRLLKSETEEKKQKAIGYVKERLNILLDLSNLKKESLEEKSKLKIKHKVYFQPTSYEIVKTDEEIQILKEKYWKLNKNQFIDTDGNIVWNYTGINFWIKKDKWECVNYELGKKKELAAKTYQELTDSERQEIANEIEVERINTMSTSEKENEKKKAIDKLTIMAVNKKAGLEIAGDSSEDALKKSREWYSEELEKIEEKYG